MFRLAFRDARIWIFCAVEKLKSVDFDGLGGGGPSGSIARTHNCVSILQQYKLISTKYICNNIFVKYYVFAIIT